MPIRTEKVGKNGWLLAFDGENARPRIKNITVLLGCVFWGRIPVPKLFEKSKTKQVDLLKIPIRFTARPKEGGPERPEEAGEN